MPRTLLSIVFSLGFLLAGGQNADQTMAFAREQISYGNYNEAKKALSRVLFFDNGVQYPETFGMLADLYFRQSDFENAWNFYDHASIVSGNDSLKAEFTLLKASCRLYSRDYNESLMDLMSYQGNISDHQQQQFDILFAITYFYLNDYEKSELHFKKSADSTLYNTIEQGFLDISRAGKRYNPRTARLLSIFLPGSGQMYAGDYKNGFNSLLLVSGFAVAGIGLSGIVRFYDAAIIVFPWFQRYYMGGYQKAYSITEARRQSVRNDILRQLIEEMKGVVE